MGANLFYIHLYGWDKVISSFFFATVCDADFVLDDGLGVHLTIIHSFSAPSYVCDGRASALYSTTWQ